MGMLNETAGDRQQLCTAVLASGTRGAELSSRSGGLRAECGLGTGFTGVGGSRGKSCTGTAASVTGGCDRNPRGSFQNQIKAYAHRPRSDLGEGKSGILTRGHKRGLWAAVTKTPPTVGGVRSHQN